MNLLGIDNVFFQVGDLDQAIIFYEKLGFVVKFRLPHMQAALLRIGTEEPGLILTQSAQVVPSKLWIEVASAKEAQKELASGKLFEISTGWTLEIIDPWNNVIGFADYTKKPELSRTT